MADKQAPNRLPGLLHIGAEEPPPIHELAAQLVIDPPGVQGAHRLEGGEPVEVGLQALALTFSLLRGGDKDSDGPCRGNRNREVSEFGVRPLQLLHQPSPLGNRIRIRLEAPHGFSVMVARR